jgi:hypothetical protein
VYFTHLPDVKTVAPSAKAAAAAETSGNVAAEAPPGRKLVRRQGVVPARNSALNASKSPRLPSCKKHELELENVIAALLQQRLFRRPMAAQTVLDEINRRLDGRDPTPRNMHIDNGVAFVMAWLEVAKADAGVDADCFSCLRQLVNDRLRERGEHLFGPRRAS